MQQNINPKHYTSGGIQPIEYIDANKLGYYEGNILKYITRYKMKNGLEDLRKAQWYLERLIDNTIVNEVTEDVE
jgi:hypothetical protein